MRRLTPLFATAVLALAGWLLYRTLSRYSFGEIVASIRALPPARLALAGGFAAASYLCLTGFDWLALRYAGHRLPYRRVALTSFVSLSIGHNLGFAALSSGAIRYRFYSRYGLGIGDIAKVVLFCGATVGMGLLLAGSTALAIHPEIATHVTGLDPSIIRVVVGVGFALVGAYLALTALWRQPLWLRRWSVRLPAPGLALRQLLVGPINYVLVAGCLHQTLAGTAEVSYLTVLTVYVVGNVAVLMTHVPGGLGVIESVVLYLLPDAGFIGALIMFRVLYFLVPLGLGALLFLTAELALRCGGAGAAGTTAARTASSGRTAR